MFRVALSLLALLLASNGNCGEFGNPAAQEATDDCIFQSGFECPPFPDAGPTVGGKVLDYWTLSAVPDALVITLAPPKIDISDDIGQYLLEDFASNTAVTIHTSKPPGFRQARNVEILIGEQSLEEDIFVAPEASILSQFATIGTIEQDHRAIVIAEIRDSDQSPLEGIPLANVVLTNSSMVPIGDGPYYFGPAGDIDPTITTSTSYMGRGTRLAILNVPSGEATLTVTRSPPDSNLSVTFVAEPDVVHFLLLD